MTDIATRAEPAVEQLLKADEDQLFEELGIRAHALETEPEASGSFDPPVVFDEDEMGILDDVRDFGKRLFGRWNRELNELICGSDPESRQERAKLAQRLGVSQTAAAAYLAGLLVTTFGLAPALAAVAAAIIMKRFFQPAVDEFCDSWRKAVEQE